MVEKCTVEHNALFCREGEYGREVGNVLWNTLPCSAGKENSVEK
jgi:hypothetical protein